MDGKGGERGSEHLKRAKMIGGSGNKVKKGVMEGVRGAKE